MKTALLILFLFASVGIKAEDSLDIHSTLITTYKHMDINYKTTGNDKKEYYSAELIPHFSYINHDYGLLFKGDIVFRYSNGEGTIAPKSNSLFCPDFSYQEEGEAVYLESLYFGKQFKTGDVLHEVGVGLPPFSKGWPYEYKEHNIPRGTGMEPLVQMSYESIYYSGDLTKLTSFDKVQFVLSYGRDMGILPTNPDLNNEKYEDSHGVVAFLQISEEKNRYKFMYQYDEFTFVNKSTTDPNSSETKQWNLGDTHLLGLGYAYNDLEDNGFIFYDMIAVSHHRPDKNDMGKIHALIDNCVERRINELGMPEALRDENVGTDSSTGWSNLIGIKKEIDMFEIDKTVYVGAEWFKTSKDWFTKSVDSPTTSLYNLYTKGDIYTLYTGIYFKPNMSLNVSYSKVKNRWVNSLGSVNVGYDLDDTVRDAYISNDILTVKFVWDF